MKSFVIHALWDAEAGVWVGSSDVIPVVSEAATLETLIARLRLIAPEMIAENGLAAPGETVTLEVVAERSEAVALPAA
jgi:Domain of unknown function (DUF1902)